MRKFILVLSFFCVLFSVTAQSDSIPTQSEAHLYNSYLELPFRSSKIKNITLFEDPTKKATIRSVYQNKASLIWKDWQTTIPEVNKEVV